MSQRLVVVRDRRRIDPDAERLGEVPRRQLPQPAEQAIGGPPREHDLARRLEPEQLARDQRQRRGRLALRDDWQGGLTTLARGHAACRERADQAARGRRRAQRRAELHEALVEIAGRGGGGQGGHQLAGPRPQRLHAGGRLDVIGDAEHAREHAGDVAVDQRRALAVRDRGDRARRVRADAGDRTQLARMARQLAAESVADDLRAGVQVARARVVPEPGPRREHVVERRGRERGHRRKPRHPAFPVRDHGGHPRLLQHDLADPDRVRVARAPPRQIAAHDREVIDHRGRERAHHWLTSLRA